MNNDYLIKMANEIASFYEAWPDVKLARDEIANHLSRFWDIRMRRQIIEHVQQRQGSGLKPLAIEAVRDLATR